MSDAIQIEKQETAAGGRYVARVAGRDGEAQLIFTRRGPDRISADHTEAPPSLRGTGVARALVERMVADARREGFRIVAVCPYVQGEAKKHPEWGDAFAAPPATN